MELVGWLLVLFMIFIFFPFFSPITIHFLFQLHSSFSISFSYILEGAGILIYFYSMDTWYKFAFVDICLGENFSSDAQFIEKNGVIFPFSPAFACLMSLLLSGLCSWLYTQLASSYL